MPELPEVEITARKLKKSGLEGLRILAPPRNIGGRKIKKIWRKGKVIFFDLSGKPPRTLAIHLGMSGKIALVGKNSTNMPIYRHIRLSLVLSGGKKLIFNDPRKFGRVWCDDPKTLFKGGYLGSLGPDMLGIIFKEFRMGLGSRKGAIKPVLLRQDVFAGIGNIIADEALWMSKIHPKTSIQKLHDRGIYELYKNLKKVIREILRHGGTSMRDWAHPDGKTGAYQTRFNVYRQDECPRCGQKINRTIVGGRKSHFCPKCQLSEFLGLVHLQGIMDK